MYTDGKTRQRRGYSEVFTVERVDNYRRSTSLSRKEKSGQLLRLRWGTMWVFGYIVPVTNYVYNVTTRRRGGRPTSPFNVQILKTVTKTTQPQLTPTKGSRNRRSSGREETSSSLTVGWKHGERYQYE